jgi:hypothetical protein
MGSATKLRKGAMDFSIEGPVTMLAAMSGGHRALNSCQKRSSGQSSSFASRSHWT